MVLIVKYYQWAGGLAAAAAVAIFRFKVGMIGVLAACALGGVGLHLAGLN